MTDSPKPLHLTADVDWSAHYAALGKFIVEYEKVTFEVRSSYAGILQYKDLTDYTLGTILLNIDALGLYKLSEALRSAVAHLYSEDTELMSTAKSIHKRIDKLAKKETRLFMDIGL